MPAGPAPVAIESPPPPQRTVHQNHYIPYEIDTYAAASQWASAQLAEKHRRDPKAIEFLQSHEALVDQYLAALKQ